MATLEQDFENKLAAAVLPDRDEARELAEDLLAFAEERWKAYASANDYDIEHIWEDAEVTDVSVGPRSVGFRVEWPFSAMFEFGVDPHVIEAKDADVLAFPWPEMEGEPYGDTGKTWDEVFADTWPVVFLPRVNWGSKTDGIPKARAVRNALRDFRGELGR